MNCPICEQFRIDQIPENFEGEIDITLVNGPGSWIGRMDPSGDVPLPDSVDDENSNYTF